LTALFHIGSVRRSLRLALGALGVLAVGVAIWRSPAALVVRAVQFDGNTRASARSLRHLVDLPSGTSVLSVDLNGVARRAEAHPWVREAGAQLAGRRVVVTVSEYEPVALAQIGARLFYVDAEGEDFLAARTEDLDYPVLTGLTQDAVALHPDLTRLVLQDDLALLHLLAQDADVSSDAVSEIAFSQTRGYTVYLRSGAEVLFGLSDHAAAALRLGVLISRGVDLSSPVHVDLGPRRVAIVRPVTSRPPVLSDSASPLGGA